MTVGRQTSNLDVIVISTLKYDWCMSSIKDQQKRRHTDRQISDFDHTVTITKDELEKLTTSIMTSKKNGRAIYMM